jgi:hypothetical protein
MFSGRVRRKVKALRIARSSPGVPPFTRSRSFSVRGWKRYMNASMSRTPCASAAACISRHWAAESASGFSQRTCFFFSAARIVHSRWRLFGSGM